MDYTIEECGAVIAAAGMSSRMVEFKPLLPLGSSTMIGEAIKTLFHAQVSLVTVVAGRDADKLRAALGDTAEVIENKDYASTDMFYSAKLGLAHIGPLVRRVFFLPCDVPLFKAETLSAMAAEMDRTDADVVIPAFDGRRGHPVLIRSAAIDDIAAYDGSGGLRGAFTARLGGRVRTVAVRDIGVTLDADDKDDYRRLLQIVEECS